MSVFVFILARSSMLYHEIYTLSPQSPWMIFIHGAGGSRLTWKYQVQGFKPFFNLLLLDLRDHGNSKDICPEYRQYNLDILTDDIIFLMDHLRIKDAYLMSLSLGSIFVQHIAGKRPDLVKGTVMAGAVCKANARMKLLAFLARAVYPILPFKTTYHLFAFVIMPRKNHRNSRRIFRSQARKLSPGDFNKWMSLLGEFLGSLEQTFHEKLIQPSLIVMGAQDHVFYSAALQYARNQSLAKLLTLDGCGHVCNLEKPEIFNRAVLDFLLNSKPSTDQ